MVHSLCIARFERYHYLIWLSALASDAMQFNRVCLASHVF